MSTATESTAVAVRETQDAVQSVTALTITTREEYGLMLQAVVAVKGLITRVTAHHKPMKEKAHAAWQEVISQEKKLLTPLQEAEKLGKRRMDAWDAEQERIAREEQARLRREQEERERAARAEAQRLAAEAARLEADGKAKAAAKMQAAAAVQEQKAETAAAAPLPVVEAPKVAGTTQREVWGAYEVEDIELIPRDFLIPDHDKLTRYGKAMRGDAKVPGIRFYAVKQRVVS